MAWLGCIPLLAGLLGIVFIPGASICLLAGMRPRYVVALAPLISMSLVSLLPVLFAKFGMRWSIGSFAGTFVVFCLAVALICRGRARWPQRVALPSALWIGGVLAWLGHVLPAVIGRSPRTPIQQIDPTYHMNLVWFMANTGNGSSISAPTRMFGLETSETAAPSGWHDLVALMGTGRVVEATNTMAIVLPTLWVVGISLLAYVAFSANTKLVVWTQLASLVFSEFPTILQSSYPVWPNALAIALLPFACAAMWMAIRDWRAQKHSALGYVGVGAAAILITCGIALVHPSFVFNMASLSVFPLLYLLIRGIWRSPSQRRRKSLLWLGGVVLVVVGASLAMFTIPYVSAVAARMMSSYGGEPAIGIEAILKIVSGATAHKEGTVVPVKMSQALMNVCGMVLFIGAVLMCWRRRDKIVWLSWLGTAFIALIVYWRVPGVLGMIGGFWYMNAHRVIAPLEVPATLLFGLGLAQWSYLLSLLLKTVFRAKNAAGLSRAITLGVVLVAGFSAGIITKNAFYQVVYNPKSDFVTIHMSSPEIAMIERAQKKIKGPVRVIGDPTNGSAMMQALGGVEVVFPQMYYRPSNTNEAYLLSNFDKLGTDPKVCDLVRKYNIRYFYYDSDKETFGKTGQVKDDGIQVPPSPKEAELVDRGGTARLYKITACRSS